jgi:hypothetical protein
MVASVRRVVPAARIVQLTDEHTAVIRGVDDMVRMPYTDGAHLMSFRLMQFARLEPCDAIFLDTDVIVQRDLTPLYERAFDVALTRRGNIGVDPQGVDVAAVMPYNTGVMLEPSERLGFLAQCAALLRWPARRAAPLVGRSVRGEGHGRDRTAHRSRPAVRALQLYAGERCRRRARTLRRALQGRAQGVDGTARGRSEFAIAG